MSARVLTQRPRLRDENGQVALEAIIVFPIWLVVTSLFFNLVIFLGSAMLMQANVNRAALQAGSVGCVTPDIRQQFNTRQQFGIRNARLAAVTTPGSPPEAGDANPAYYRFNRSQVVDGDGNIRASAPSAFCTGPDGLGAGRWLWLQTTYEQRLWLFGTRTVRRSALTVSHTLESEQ